MNKRLVGKVGESIAYNYLIDRGFIILHRNWTCRWGEIDLIAEKGGALVFVEVKYRSGPVNCHPSQAMTFYKRKSLQRSIKVFLDKNYVTKPWRVDVLCVSRFGKLLKVDYYEYVSLL